MGFRREDIYLANVLKCRPDTPGQALRQPPAHPGRDDELPARASSSRSTSSSPRPSSLWGPRRCAACSTTRSPCATCADAGTTSRASRSWRPTTPPTCCATNCTVREAQGLGRPPARQGAPGPPDHRKRPQLLLDQGLAPFLHSFFIHWLSQLLMHDLASPCHARGENQRNPVGALFRPPP